VTSPPQRIKVACPGCSAEYEEWHRPSINLTLEAWTAEELRDATTARCPQCGLAVELESLIVEPDGTWRFS
jgi:endogenous inhibitor of DNA gyrase (YacG/DUF329 family)